MQIYIKKRFVSLVIVLVGVSILSFLLLSAGGKDPAEIMARRISITASDEAVEAIRTNMGLDKPMIMRYFNWIKGLFTGDMGVSLYSSREISKDLAEFFPMTFALVGLTLLWIIVLVVPISLLCVRFRGSILDQVIRGVTILGICIPSFWLGFMLLLVFAVEIPIFTVIPQPGLKGYILPSLTLAIPVSSSTIRLFRSSLLSQLSTDYVRYAKARGLSSGRILVRHITRNALPPTITMFCQYLGYLIAGSAVVESVFSLKGIGSYIIGCVMASDTTSVATCIVIIAAIFVFANLAGDVLNRILCPWMVKESNG